ncbi:uncharacterized protein LOC135924793 isoform X2 [Gordionus sp. m RMFG-2023]|uniref:uncharacterized protein LOC135924793 isoform X2 n=1 Tax=Gordionus sp. m RMFG-2023 TaxID=3053472 RepID=UPI0031FD945D
MFLLRAMKGKRDVRESNRKYPFISLFRKNPKNQTKELQEEITNPSRKSKSEAHAMDMEISEAGRIDHSNRDCAGAINTSSLHSGVGIHYNNAGGVGDILVPALSDSNQYYYHEKTATPNDNVWNKSYPYVQNSEYDDSNLKTEGDLLKYASKEHYYYPATDQNDGVGYEYQNKEYYAENHNFKMWGDAYQQGYYDGAAKVQKNAYSGDVHEAYYYDAGAIETKAYYDPLTSAYYDSGEVKKNAYSGDVNGAYYHDAGAFEVQTNVYSGAVTHACYNDSAVEKNAYSGDVYDASYYDTGAIEVQTNAYSGEGTEVRSNAYTDPISGAYYDSGAVKKNEYSGNVNEAYSYDAPANEFQTSGYSDAVPDARYVNDDYGYTDYNYDYANKNFDGVLDFDNPSHMTSLENNETWTHYTDQVVQ